MDKSPFRPPFSPSKFVRTPKRYYYAFGNTPAEDLLEHVPDTCKNPSVLLLGCGDIRSCLYTLWNNFDESSGHGNFEGVAFHLNDCCAAVLARNILFLYWTLKLADISPHDIYSVKQMVCSIWNVWFCHDLHHHEVVLLKESLNTLIKFFESYEAWEKPDNPLRHFVDLEGEFKQGTMEAIHQMYDLWLTMLQMQQTGGVNDEVILLKQKRVHEVQSRVAQNMEHLFNVKFGIYAHATENLKKLMQFKNEYRNYIETGNAFAGQLFGMSQTDTDSVLNPTLYEKVDQYTLHYASMPYDCFVHGLFMTKENIDFPPGTLLVQQEKFEKFPLLANSVQQFSLWLMSAAKCLSKCHLQQGKAPISFSLYYSDAINAVVRLRHNNAQSHPCFDIIHASNLIDHLTPFILVMNTITLLKENGLLLTTALHHRSRGLGVEFNTLVEMTLNFKLEHLLPLFGIRCCGHEGIYAGSGILKNSPSFQLVFENKNYLLVDLPCLLIWKLVNTTPLCLLSLEKDSFTTKILFDCIKGTLGFLDQSKLGVLIGISGCHVSTHNAMTALKVFLDRLSSESLKSASGFKFWDGLCSRLQNDTALQPFLLHLQCQAILMNIHMHLTTTSSDCPICNNTLTHYFQKISLPFDASFEHGKYHSQSAFSSIVLVCIHPNNVHGKEVFLFDSSICTVAEMNGLVEIVIPRNMIDVHKYSATVYCYNYFRRGEQCIRFPMSTVSLKDINTCVYSPHDLISNPNYSLICNPSSSFGKLALMEYTGSQYIANISLSAEVLSYLQDNYKLRSEMISDTSFKMICRSSHFIVEYSTPIDYNSVKIKYSRTRKLVMIEARCKPFDTYSEKQIPLFFVNPQNKIILPRVNVSEKYLHQSFLSQITSAKDLEMLVNIHRRDPFTLPPSINAKKVFGVLFQQIYPYFLLISKKDDCDILNGLIVVHNRLFDVINLAPALDLSFYINEAGIDIHSDVFRTWSLMRLANSHFKEHNILVTNEISLLEKILSQFSNRVRISNKKVASPLSCGMEKYFRRAITYHLTSNISVKLDLEAKSLMIQHCSSVEPTQQKLQPTCSRCKAKSSDLKKCMRCKMVVYCNKQCQREDWNEHKLICKPT